MSRQVQIRRGDVAANDNFIGAIGEVTMDTTNNTLRVHDGQTLGGTVLAKQSEIPNLAPFDYVVAWQMPNAANNYTWYRKYKSGWVEMGGRAVTTVEKTTTFYLPIELNDSTNNITYSVIGAWNDSPVVYHVRTLAQTRNSVTVCGIQQAESSTSRQTVSFFWRIAAYV